MLKAQHKQNLVLVVFAALMFEVLTGATVTFVILGVLSVTFGMKASKLVRNILAIGVFASYWITYGKLIDPEVGLNFLTSIIVLKILERETDRDHYMIFFGLVLLLSAGALFEKTLTYVFFFSFSFLVLLRDFYLFLGIRFRAKDLGMALLWVTPLTFSLFFLVPRLMNPIPFNQNTLAPGEIGYTPDVNISEVESLVANNSPVFQVAVNRKLRQKDLYWRGNTLSFSDGWNWRLMPQDKIDPEYAFAAPSGNMIKQSIRLFTTPEFFFALDRPGYVSYGKQFFILKNDKRTFPQVRWNWVQRYTAHSDATDLFSEGTGLRKYLQNPLPKSDKEMVRSTFKGNTVAEIESSIREYFFKNEFVYSLSPGRTLSLKDFFELKKGFCSHFASSAALILRTKGVPARLVSGYMGGSYNSFGDFYVINQNDAHVWVEALENGKWIRLDPTEWIAPNRVELGGEAFIESVTANEATRLRFFKFPGFLNTIRQWFQQWDYHFYQWLEQMDYYNQEAWLDKLHLKRQWLYSIVPAVLVVFMAIYTWFMSRKGSRGKNDIQELWTLFYRRMKKRGHELSPISVSQSAETLASIQNEDIHNVWKELVAVSFEGRSISIKDLRKRIKKI